MSPVPPLPSLRRAAKPAGAGPDASRLAAEVQAKLTLARRLRDEDAARRATSVAPPSTPIR